MKGSAVRLRRGAVTVEGERLFWKRKKADETALPADDRIMVGWREWVALPALGIPAIKAKVDTGARTSAIHAYKVHRYRADGGDRLSFLLHPNQDDDAFEVPCEAPLLDLREITSSNGQKQRRFVIETELQLGEARYPIELTLTNRDEMGFRMLLGRRALKDHCLVDPAASYLSRPKPKKKKRPSGAR